ncbi:hypothetical protein KFK09_022326 [Dendrobium nobile]|uniref:Uncharacterized protein n=1 Tax=Dendrobium nobile TaxID=94219 RepID=A0A8T3AIB6_DENNO|nr:hypothetical protein KFK09_022326 [Dendrobium nobile]
MMIAFLYYPLGTWPPAKDISKKRSNHLRTSAHSSIKKEKKTTKENKLNQKQTSHHHICKI